MPESRDLFLWPWFIFCLCINIWFFPTLISENGSGIFLFLYIILSISFGLFFIFLEISLINKMGKDIGARSGTLISLILKKKNKRAPDLILLASAIFISIFISTILSFIAIKSLEFLLKSQFDLIFDFKILVLAFSVLAFIISLFPRTFFDLSYWVKVFGVLFFVLIFVIVVKSLSLPNTFDYLREQFYPDFWGAQKLTINSILKIMNFIFFSLGIGSGGVMLIISPEITKKIILEKSTFLVISNIVMSLLSCALFLPIMELSGFGATRLELSTELFPRFLFYISSNEIIAKLFHLLLFLSVLFQVAFVFSRSNELGIKHRVNIFKTVNIILFTFILMGLSRSGMFN